MWYVKGIWLKWSWLATHSLHHANIRLNIVVYSMLMLSHAPLLLGADSFDARGRGSQI